MQDLQSGKTQADLQHCEENVIFAHYFFYFKRENSRQ